MQQRQQRSSESVLRSLRALFPTRPRIPFTEALRIAERQANRLIDMHGISSGPVPTSIISELPKVVVKHTGRFVLGATFWDANRNAWIIYLSNAEPAAHNRFTLAHEYKHIIDHGKQTLLYRGTSSTDPDAQAEQAADYFAGCLLVPRRFLKAAWQKGVQTTGELAEMFDVSEYTIGNRLRQTGLVEHRHLRHLPAPLPFIADDEVEPQPGDDLTATEEGAIPA